MLADTPTPPYYAVIFSNTRTDLDDGYGDTADRMVELAALQPGFLGVESVRDGQSPGRPGITVSYWTDLDAIAAWKGNAEHLAAQDQGFSHWYSGFRLRIARVERASGFDAAA